MFKVKNPVDNHVHVQMLQAISATSEIVKVRAFIVIKAALVR